MNIDQIADMLTRIRNAQFVKKTDVSMPSSKLKVALAKLLNKNGYLGNVVTFSENNKNYLKIELIYSKGVAAIKGIKRISHQGQRIYTKKGDIPIVKNGYGLAVVSTSQGLMTDTVARKKGLGGEIICQIW
jgi:small subunit ribosomal protein S8